MPSFTFTSLFTNQTLNRNDFIANVRTRIDQSTIDSSILTDVQIEQFIREGNYDINFRTKLLPEYATVALDGSVNYTLPANMSELYELILISADTPATYTMIESSNLFQVQQDGFDQGTVKFYVRNGMSLELFGSDPTTGTLRAYGARIPTNPATGTDFIDLPDQYLELMYLWIEWKFWVRRREPDEAAIARDLYLSRAISVADQVKDQFSRGVTAYG